LKCKHGDLSRDFWIVAHQTYLKTTWHQYLRYTRSGDCTQETVAKSFFHAVYLEEEGRYTIKEVGGIGSCNNYVTIKLP
jgi:hypothetical protein